MLLGPSLGSPTTVPVSPVRAQGDPAAEWVEVLGRERQPQLLPHPVQQGQQEALEFTEQELREYV